MTTKARIAKAERDAKRPRPPRLETVTKNPEYWERSMTALADALGVARADLDEHLKTLRSNEVKP